MTSVDLRTIKTRLTLSFDDVNMHLGAIRTYAEVVTYLLRWYTAGAVIAKTDE